MSTAATLHLASLPLPTHHGFFYNLMHEVEDLWHKAPSWSESANAVLQIAIPAVQLVIDLDEPELAPVIDPVLSRVKVGVATLALMAKQGGSHPTLLTMVQVLQANTKELESVTRISNPDTQAKISANLNLLTSELAAFEAMLQPVIIPPGVPTTIPTLQASGERRRKHKQPGKTPRAARRSTTAKR